ncbi:hypothetical protein [Streptomyces natalensis]|nr:hypothetical protein [Streptomyces natalensis]
MPKSRSGRALVASQAEADEPTADTRRRRLVTLLADMVPGACTVRVSQQQPGQNWPSPYARAYDAQGQLMALNRAQRVTVARWVIRAHPYVPWDETYDLDLATGALRATGGGR